MTNPLLEEPTTHETAKSVAALVKLGLALSGNPAAVALGALLETLLFTGLAKWESQPSEVLTTNNDNLSQIPDKADVHSATVTEMLSYFSIKTIEIPRDSLLRLLRSESWNSSKGGISLLVPGRPIVPSSWFSAQLLPEALYNSSFLLRRVKETVLLTATFPAARHLPENPIHVASDDLIESLIEPKLQGDSVAFTAVRKADTSQDLIEHGIRLTPGPQLPGFLVTFEFPTPDRRTNSHRHVLIPDLSSTEEAAT